MKLKSVLEPEVMAVFAWQNPASISQFPYLLRSPPDPDSWRDRARFCQNHPHLLNTWEENFLESILERDREPTEKQELVLRKLLARITTRYVAYFDSKPETLVKRHRPIPRGDCGGDDPPDPTPAPTKPLTSTPRRRIRRLEPAD